MKNINLVFNTTAELSNKLKGASRVANRSVEDIINTALLAYFEDEVPKEKPTNTEELRGLEELEGVIARGGEYWNLECISSGDLFAKMKSDHPDIELNNKAKNALLKKLGYIRYPVTIKIDGTVKRCWTKKKKMTNSDIRETFLKYYIAKFFEF